MCHFKSRTDKHPRHTIKRVDLLSARRVDPTELEKMTPTEPRPRSTAAESSSEQTVEASTEAKSIQAGKKKDKKKGRRGKRKQSPAGALKSAVAKSFATSTQTIGSIQGCMARALLPSTTSGLSRQDIRQLADRLQTAVKVINSARIYVFKMLELIVFGELLSTSDDPTDSASDSYSDTTSASADSDSGSDSVSAPESEEELSGPSNTSDVLDLILTKST
ncbi:hypothetical protein BGX28_001554, partial [Mortierella sp. GBA30]